MEIKDRKVTAKTAKNSIVRVTRPGRYNGEFYVLDSIHKSTGRGSRIDPQTKALTPIEELYATCHPYDPNSMRVFESTTSCFNLDDLIVVKESGSTSVPIQAETSVARKPKVATFSYKEGEAVKDQIFLFLTQYPEVTISGVSVSELDTLVVDVERLLAEREDVKKTTISANEKGSPHQSQQEKIIHQIYAIIYKFKINQLKGQGSRESDSIDKLKKMKRHEDNKSKQKGETHHLV
jgi:hypothetical protein